MKPITQSLALKWAELDSTIGSLEDLGQVTPARLRKLLRRAFYAGAAASLELTGSYAAANGGNVTPMVAQMVAEITESLENL